MLDLENKAFYFAVYKNTKVNSHHVKTVTGYSHSTLSYYTACYAT